MMKDLTLSEIKSGQSVKIKGIFDQQCAVQALRMGITEGEVVMCVARVPQGPTVLQHGGMEVAVGRDLCRKIEVEPV